MSLDSNSLILALSNSLRDFLSISIGISQNDIRFESLGELPNLPDQGISLFLYKISENPYLKNADQKQEFYANPVKLRNPPLALDLHYLITSFGNSENRLVILEQVLQLFYDFPVLDKSQLSLSLIENGNTEIKVLLQDMSIEQLSSLWNMFPNVQYRPTLSYLVSPLLISSSKITDTAISRVITKNIPHYSISSAANSK